MEQRQRFSIRKFKTMVGSALIASFLVGAPLLNAWTVLAQEQAQTTMTQKDLKNTTNLSGPKKAMPDLGKKLQEKAGTSTGELVHSVSSDLLAEAVKKAQAAGVDITKAKTTRYDSLEAAQADYAGQLENLEAVIAKQEAATKAYQEAVASYKLYQEATVKYEADKSLHDAYLAAKADYDKAFEAYQVAFEAYEKELANNVKLLADYELAKAEYTKAYSLYQDKLTKYTDTTKANEAKKAAYETALEQYKKDYAAYEKALAAHRTATETDVAKEAEYQKALTQYNKDYEQYQKDLASYQKEAQEAEKNTGRDGYPSEVSFQALEFNSEPNATFTASGVINKNDYGYVLKAGEQLVLTYTGIENSTYDGTKISKIVYTYTGKGAGANLQPIEDPTLTLNMRGLSERSSSGETRVGFKAEFYDVDGNIIGFSESAPALISLASLNRNSPYSGTGTGESVELTASNTTFIPITGSTIAQTGNIIASSIIDNSNKDKGSKYDASKNGVIVEDPNDYWDTLNGPLRYYGAGLLKVSSGTAIEFDIFNQWEDSVGGNDGSYYFGFNTKVATTRGVFRNPPTPPTKPTPPKSTVTGNEPQQPTPPVEPTYEQAEKPTPPVEPTKPLITEPQKPTEPTPPGIVPPPPGEPTPVPIPKEPEALSVTVHKATYTTTPKAVKKVMTASGQEVNNALIPKGSTVKFSLTLPDLKANRQAITTFMIEDVIDEGIDLDVEAIKAAYPLFDVTYDKQRLLKLTAKKDYLDHINQDVTKDYSFKLPDLVGRVVTDGGTYTNTMKVTLNDYVTHTNNVKVTTPGNPNDPDHPTNNLIEPTKTVTNLEGQNINGQAILATDQLVYPNLWDLDQYATIASGDKEKAFFFFVEDIDGTKVTPNLDKSSLTDKAKEAVKGVSVKHVESYDKADKTVQEALTAAGLADKIEGDFILLLPDDMAAFEETYIKTGNSINFDLVLTPKEDATGVIKNTSYQVDYNNGYVTKTIENPIQVTTEWEDKTTNKPLKDKVTGDKTQAKGEFPNYRFVETVSTKTGIKHLFERLYTTEWEEEGTKKVLKDKVTDTKTHEKGEFDGMTFVKTVDTATGMKHLFKKVEQTPPSSSTPPANKSFLPSTGEQATTIIGYLGGVLIGLAIAWKTGLLKRIKELFKK